MIEMNMMIVVMIDGADDYDSDDRDEHDDGSDSSDDDNDGDCDGDNYSYIYFIYTTGWKDGTKITFEGEGDESAGVLPADIVFVVKTKPHDRFTRDGDNLLYEVSR